MIHQVAIIGAGPAGIAAAIQLKRSGINPVLFESGAIGGLLHSANLVENYPGFPGGIKGFRLAGLFKDHLERIKVEVVFEKVSSITSENGDFNIRTSTASYRSRIVIMATGTRANKLTVKGVPEAEGSRVFYELSQVGDVKEKRIAIIGAGDAAFDYALNLAQHNQVVINNRGVEASCLPLLWDRVNNNSNIVYRTCWVLKECQTIGGRLCLSWDNEGSISQDYYDYLVVAIGRTPVLDYLSDSVLSDLDQYEAEELIYRVGDLRNGRFRQVSISVGDGVMAAMKILQKINENQ